MIQRRNFLKLIGFAAGYSIISEVIDLDAVCPKIVNVMSSDELKTIPHLRVNVLDFDCCSLIEYSVKDKIIIIEKCHTQISFEESIKIIDKFQPKVDIKFGQSSTTFIGE